MLERDWLGRQAAVLARSSSQNCQAFDINKFPFIIIWVIPSADLSHCAESKKRLYPSFAFYFLALSPLCLL